MGIDFTLLDKIIEDSQTEQIETLIPEYSNVVDKDLSVAAFQVFKNAANSSTFLEMNFLRIIFARILRPNYLFVQPKIHKLFLGYLNRLSCLTFVG